MYRSKVSYILKWFIPLIHQICIIDNEVWTTTKLIILLTNTLCMSTSVLLYNVYLVVLRVDMYSHNYTTIYYMCEHDLYNRMKSYTWQLRVEMLFV